MRCPWCRAFMDSSNRAHVLACRIKAEQSFLIPPPVPTDLPLELCLTEEILESVGDVDGEV
jgi:hypothetical protein